MPTLYKDVFHVFSLKINHHNYGYILEQPSCFQQIEITEPAKKLGRIRNANLEKYLEMLNIFYWEIAEQMHIFTICKHLRKESLKAMNLI